MGLREDALAAAEAARSQRVNTARSTLADTLSPTDVAELELADVTSELVVFCGEELCLAVRHAGVPGDRVTLVRQDAGWTYLGSVASLVDLGLLLARLDV